MLTVSQAAEKLGVTAKTIRVWEKTGKLKAYRTVGRHRRFVIDEIVK